MSANWGVMQSTTLYDHPNLYDRLVPPGPCEAYYGALAGSRALVLELGCGTGRLTIPLALAGERSVTGLDASPAMLASAQAKAAAAGAQVSWVIGDMSGFDLGRRFDLVIVSCNSLAHMTSDEALSGCLTSVRRHLKEGGTFAFDVVNPDLKLLRRPIKERMKRAAPSSGVRLREVARYDEQTRVREARWRVYDQDGSICELDFQLRQFAPDELERALECAGLHLTARFGDFDRNRFSARSRLQVCVAHAA